MLKSRTRSIRLTAAKLSITLNEHDTLWSILSFHRFSLIFRCNIHDSTLRFALYLSIFMMLDLVFVFLRSSSPIGPLIANTLQLILVSNIVLECNITIFKRSLTTFQVYYNVISICISLVAFNIDYHFWRNMDLYDNNVLYANCTLEIVKNGFAVFIVCILDGYNIASSLKVIVCVCIVLRYFYFYYLLIYLDYTSSDSSGTLFGESFRLHTLAVVTMNQTVAFMMYKCYLYFKKAGKLVLVPTFVPFEFVHDRYYNKNSYSRQLLELNYDHNLYSQHTFNTDFDDTIKIDTKESILYVILRKRCHINYNYNKLSSIFGSKYLLFTCTIVWNMIAFGIIILRVIPSDLKSQLKLVLNGWWQTCLYSIAVVALLMIILNFNCSVIKYNLRMFKFWWKMCDATLEVAAILILWFKQDLQWDGSFSFALSDVIADTIVYVVFFYAQVFVVANIAAFIALEHNFSMSRHNRHKRHFIANNIILAAIILHGAFGFIYFMSDDDYEIVLNLFNSSVKISLRTIMIAKRFDLAIFFMLQWYRNIKNGIYGIHVTGCVNTVWHVNNSNETVNNIALQLQS